MGVVPFFWLQSVANHPDTDQADLLIAEALITEGEPPSAVAVPCDSGGVEILDRREVDESIDLLIGLGFIESVVAVDCDCAAGGCESHLLVFRMPAAASAAG
jgi:hypothetical protein